MEEITKDDLEAFIEHEQDRGLMISTVRTRLHCVNAFLGYLIEAGVIRGDVLARRIRLRKPETLAEGHRPGRCESITFCYQQSQRPGHGDDAFTDGDENR